MGRKPGVITSKHTVIVSFDGHSAEAQSLISKTAKRKPSEVVDEGSSTRIIYTYKYHASAEKAMNKILNLNSNPSEFRIDNLKASIAG